MSANDHDHDHENEGGGIQLPGGGEIQTEPTEVAQPTLGVAQNFRVTLHDDDLAAWMTITNSFAYDFKGSPPMPGSSHNNWHGILIQWGEYVEAGGNLELMNVFGDVVVKRPGGDTTLDKAKLEDSFYWINVVQWANPSPSASQQPMGLGDLRNLHIRHPMIKPLHQYLLPFPGGITLWTEGDLKILAEPILQGMHGKVTFELASADPVQVSVFEWLDPKGMGNMTTMLNGVTDVTEIDLRPQGGIHHGGRHNPPQT